MKRSVRVNGTGTATRSTCGRCQGFMVPSTTDSQLLETIEQPTVPAWRCVNCGEWIDATVAINRASGGRATAMPSSLVPFSRRRWRW